MVAQFEKGRHVCGVVAVTALSARRCSLACDGCGTLGTWDRVKGSDLMLLEKRRVGRPVPSSIGVVNAVGGETNDGGSKVC